jgi:hypothetical protein
MLHIKYFDAKAKLLLHAHLPGKEVSPASNMASDAINRSASRHSKLRFGQTILRGVLLHASFCQRRERGVTTRKKNDDGKERWRRERGMITRDWTKSVESGNGREIVHLYTRWQTVFRLPPFVCWHEGKAVVYIKDKFCCIQLLAW